MCFPNAKGATRYTVLSAFGRLAFRLTLPIAVSHEANLPRRCQNIKNRSSRIYFARNYRNFCKSAITRKLYLDFGGLRLMFQSNIQLSAPFGLAPRKEYRVRGIEYQVNACCCYFTCSGAEPESIHPFGHPAHEIPGVHSEGNKMLPTCFRAVFSSKPKKTASQKDT